MWINSLNIGTYITNLTSDMKDGLVVLQVKEKKTKRKFKKELKWKKAERKVKFPSQ